MTIPGGKQIMRLIILAGLTWTLGATAALGQTSWAEKLFPDGITHDFGNVPRGTVLTHPFKVKNIYAVPLEVSTRVGCNCVTVSPQSFTVQPRQETTLDITMDARRFTGDKRVNIYVTVGPEYVSSTTLQVSAHSRVDVVLNPGQVNFGVVASGTTPPAQTVDVEYAGGLDWKITEVAGNNSPFDVSAKELYRRPGQVGYRVTVALKPNAAAGPAKQEISLKTNDPSSPIVPLLVEANVQASLSVVPGNVNFGTLRVGESVSKRVIVRGSRPFHVVSVDGATDGVSADLPTAAASVQVVLLKFQPTRAGALKKQLQIKTDLDKESAGSVTVEGTAEP